MKSLLSIAFLGLICFSSYGQQKNELSDSEVASAAVVANQIDIEYAQIALKRSKNSDIVDFANRMAKDHQAVIDQSVALANKLGVVPKDNALSQSLLGSAKKTKKELKRISGKNFDKKYIDNEVAYHQAVIEAVKNLLIPQTENAELKELLENVLPALEVHLEHAKMVQNKMM